MPYRNLEPVSKQLTIVVGLTVVGFMAFGLALSFYRNVLFEQTIGSIEGQNEEFQRQIEEKYEDLDYFRSAQYKDKYAKENLGRLNRGEKVLIITEKPEEMNLHTGQVLTPEERREAEYDELLREMPAIEQWKLYLLFPEKMEEFKRGM